MYSILKKKFKILKFEGMEEYLEDKKRNKVSHSTHIKFHECGPIKLKSPH